VGHDRLDGILRAEMPEFQQRILGCGHEIPRRHSDAGRHSLGCRVAVQRLWRLRESDGRDLVAMTSEPEQPSFGDYIPQDAVGATAPDANRVPSIVQCDCGDARVWAFEPTSKVARRCVPSGSSPQHTLDRKCILVQRAKSLCHVGPMSSTGRVGSI